MRQSQSERFATALVPALEKALSGLARADPRLRPHVDVIPSLVYDFSILGWLSRVGSDDEEIVISINKALDHPSWAADVVDVRSQPIAEASWTEEIQLEMASDAEVARRHVEQFLADAMVAMAAVLGKPEGDSDR